MPTYLENLTTARDNLTAKLAEISVNPKPSYSVNGQSFSWVEYYKFLAEQQEKLNTQIIANSEPVEIVSQGLT